MVKCKLTLNDERWKRIKFFKLLEFKLSSINQWQEWYYSKLFNYNIKAGGERIN
jgi:hypothetical protein